MLMQQKLSQLLIVGIQDKVLSPVGNQQDIVFGVASLIQAAKLFSIPITVVEHDPDALGATIAQIRTLAGNKADVFPKLYFSALRDDAVQARLEDHRDMGRGQIVIAGVEAHLCVTQTALDLIGDGYEVFVVADAVGSRKECSRRLSLRRLARAGANLVDTEMVIFEWSEKAGTPEFKALHALISAGDGNGQSGPGATLKRS